MLSNFTIKGLDFERMSVSEHLALFRLLEERGDGGIVEGHETGHSALQLYNGPPSTFIWLLRQSELEIQHCIAPEPLWYYQLRYFKWEWGFNPASRVRELLRIEESPARVITQRTSAGYTILHCTVCFWSQNLEWFSSGLVSDFEQARQCLKDCELLIQGILKAGGDIHTLSSSGKTPLLTILSNRRLCFGPDYSYTIHDSRRSLRKTIASWFRLIDEAGFDLCSYKKQEQALWDKQIFDLWDDFSSFRMLPYYGIDIQWKTEERPRFDKQTWVESMIYFLLLTGDALGEEYSGDRWDAKDDGGRLIGGRFFRVEKYEEEVDDSLKIPGSWV
jgi:hypothetical protein